MRSWRSFVLGFSLDRKADKVDSNLSYSEEGGSDRVHNPEYWASTTVRLTHFHLCLTAYAYKQSICTSPRNHYNSVSRINHINIFVHLTQQRAILHGLYLPIISIMNWPTYWMMSGAWPFPHSLLRHHCFDIIEKKISQHSISLNVTIFYSVLSHALMGCCFCYLGYVKLLETHFPWLILCCKSLTVKIYGYITINHTL